MPNGQRKKDFPNPLVNFRNPPLKEGKIIAMGDELMGENKIKMMIQETRTIPTCIYSRKCVATSRYDILAGVPDSQWVNDVNNWQACNAAMKNSQWYGNGSGSFADAVSRMFSPGCFEPWETFASTIHNSPKNLKENPSEGVSADSPADSRPRKATGLMSLEYIHNIIHELGYQYDDLVPQPNTPEDSPKYLEDLRKHIKELSVQGTPGYTLPNEKFNDYIINVIYDRYAPSVRNSLLHWQATRALE
ncbi:hypothetical protein OEA41_008717 [Lepraria neglecta]|uniref:Uncharacterized protein n=1 Tax=Lepraria neglecta TaxID=209136 RepID=A0AAD9Z090_9LECA|nr:hypothetical protein OEA41_008717 [Lepraria neglecta]